MVISQTELKSEVIELSTKAFETFFKDISDMFSVKLECAQQEVSEATINDIKKRFGGPVAVNVVKAQGVLDGVFQLIFDREALSTLAGVLIMLGEEQILENRRNKSVEYTKELTDTIAEAGNLLVGAWDRVYRENIEGHGDFTRTNSFIGEPWDEPEAKIGLSENTEVVLVSYAMTLGTSPACSCGVIFPKALLGETSETDTQLASEEQKTTTEDEASAEKKAPVKKKASPKEKASAEKKAPVKKKASPKEKASAEKKAPVKKKDSTKEKVSAEKKASVKKKAPPEEKASAKKQAPVEEKTAAEEEPSAEQQTPVEQEIITEEQVMAEEKKPADKAADETAAEEEPSAEQQTPVKQETITEGKASGEQQPPVEEETPVEKVEDEKAVAEESKESTGGEISKTIRRMIQSSPEPPTEDAPSTIEENQMFSTAGISSAVCAKDIMQKEVVWGSADDSVQEALTKMQQTDSGYMMIGENGTPEGIVSKSDITGAISPYLRPIFAKWHRPLDDATLQIRVKWIMSRPVHTIKPDTSLVNIMGTMRQSGLRALPVMDQQGNIQGMVTVFDIFKAMISEDSETAVVGKTSQAPPLA